MVEHSKVTQQEASTSLEIAHDSDKSCLSCYKLLMILVTLLGVLSVVILGLGVSGKLNAWLTLGLLGLLGGAAYVVLQLRHTIQSNLIQPLDQIIHWSDQMAEGNLHARIQHDDKQGYASLIKNINNLSEKVVRLSTKMQLEVEKQTEQAAQKTRALEVLYDAAASINISKNLQDLLLRFLPTLKDVLQAEAATVRLSNFDGQMRLIGSLGLEDSPEQDKVETLIPVLHCMYGSTIEEGQLLSKDRILHCEIYPGQPFYQRDDIEMIAVPLQYREKNLGVYNLFVKKPGLLNREDIKDLLISIGRHLGVAIEKAYTEEESKRLSIYRERSQLSHELHDSLAQTLASLKFQVRTLHNSIKRSDQSTALKELDQIKNGLDEAYTELRELIAHFRAPFDERGLISAIEKAISQFRERAKISIYFQNEWRDTKLSSIYEIQVLRIIQESLNNILKHSQARSVRIMLSYDPQGQHTVLIEDDGVGISEPVLEGKPGEQIGLTIMRERANRLGGTLDIESEAGEGTQIKLSFTPTASDLIEDALRDNSETNYGQ